MPPIPVSKRSACDRCRIQKLRCSPSADGSDACARCTRLSARCITSYPRPSNAALQPLPHPHVQPELRSKGTAPPPAAATVTTANASTSMTVNRASDPMQSPPLGRSAHSLITATTPYDSLSFEMPEDDFDYFSSSQSTILPHDDLMFLDSAHHEATNDVLYHDNRTFPLSPSALGAGGSNSLGSSGAAKEAQQQSSNTPTNEQQSSNTSTNGKHSSNTSTNEQSYNILEYNPRLSSLNLDLSRRLEQCLPIAVHEDRPMSDEARSETLRTVEGGIVGCGGLSSSNLFEHALGDLSEFLVIIQSYTSKKKGQLPGGRDNSGQGLVSGPSSRISILVLLNLISAYLQIVVIYDQIFRSLSTRLLETSEGSNCGQQTHPGLRLTGLSVGHGNLHTKILIHAILHQFDLIERMLGLPADLRVTDKPGVYSGLFEDDRARALLGAVSNGNRIENDWCQSHVDDNRLSKALSSLRETIKMVQVFLDL